MNNYLSISALFGLSAVIIGAFGTHGLESILTAHALDRYNTGVDYHFFHVAALMFVSILMRTHEKQSRLLKYSAIAFILGIILFSGSLYLFAITGISKLGVITPIGGLAFMTGWVLLIIFGIKHRDF